MRTTVTLAADVNAKIREEMRRSGCSFKEAVNELIRRGYEYAQRPDPPFEAKAFHMGPKPGLNLEKVWDLIEQLEGPLYK